MLPLLCSRIPLDHAVLGNTYLHTYDDFERYRLHVVHTFENNYDVEEYNSKLEKYEGFKGYTEMDGIPRSYLYHFELDSDFRKAYNLFTTGKYSRLSNVDKNIINNYWYDVYNKSNRGFLLTLKQIFNRDEVLKKKLESELKVVLKEDAELSSIIDIEDEIYYYGN